MWVVALEILLLKFVLFKMCHNDVILWSEGDKRQRTKIVVILNVQSLISIEGKVFSEYHSVAKKKTKRHTKVS